MGMRNNDPRQLRVKILKRTAQATAAPEYDFPAGYGQPHWSNALKDYVYEVMGDPCG